MPTTSRTAKWINRAGWAGVAIILLAYILLSFGIIGATYTYQGLTLAGSLAIATSSWLKKDKQPAVLNLIFAVIAIIAMIRLLFIQ